MLRSTGCQDIDCLLELDEAALLEHGRTVSQSESPWWPVVRVGWSPIELVCRGQYNRLPPIMLGFSWDEFASVMLEDTSTFPKVMGIAEQDHALASLLGDAGLELALKDTVDDPRWNATDDIGKHSRWWWSSMRTLSDWLVGACPHRHLSQSFMAGGTPAVYSYQLAQPDPESRYGLATHASELSHVFAPAASSAPGSPEAKFAHGMRKYWIGFIRTGDPNHLGLP